MRTETRPRDRVARTTLEVFQELFRDYHPRNFTVRLWDGTEWTGETAAPAFDLVIHRPGALRRMFRAQDTNLYLGEAFADGDFDIEGDLEAAFPMGEWLLSTGRGPMEKLRLAWRLAKLPSESDGNGHGVSLDGDLHSPGRDRSAIQFHYDRSNEFFALWLDSRMIYSCAYFETARDDLDTAQEQKLEILCRKLRLRPAERLLDIGCGWGSLVMFAAERFGVDALGITLSPAQARLATERIGRSLSERCRVRVEDYRELTAAGAFDKIVSVGMVEHVGPEKLDEYFAKAWDALRPGGVFLNHGITWNAREPRPKKPTFDNRHVFPDAVVPTLHDVVRSAELAGFEVRDVESLREHYMMTLRHWERRLEANREEALRFVDEPTYRAWKLHMAGSAYAFSIGRLNLHQTLLVKPDGGPSGLPLTRRDWYAVR